MQVKILVNGVWIALCLGINSFTFDAWKVKSVLIWKLSVKITRIFAQMAVLRFWEKVVKLCEDTLFFYLNDFDLVWFHKNKVVGAVGARETL